MPRSPGMSCTYPGCKAITHRGFYCGQHQRERKSKAEHGRVSARKRGYGSQWERARRAYLSRPENQFCRNPYSLHHDLVPAGCVDHIRPHKGDQRLFWDEANWQPLCLRCNSVKAAREEGGFGNA